MSTNERSSTATRWPGPLGRPGWVPVATLVVGIVVGFAAAHVPGGNDDPGSVTVRSGVVDSLDPSGSVCVRFDSDLACYQAPGVNLAVGQRIRFEAQAQPIDPSDLTKGTQLTITWLRRQ